MILETISEHTVAVDLLTGGPVLDAGARGFVFSKWFADRGHHVMAVDPSPDLGESYPPSLTFVRAALVASGNPSVMSLEISGDPGAWHLSDIIGHTSLLVPTVNIDKLRIMDDWDVIKLDIEGSEYDVLMTWPGPIANQITVEFHEHTARKRGDKAIQDIVDHLSQWYKPVQHEKTQAQCAGWNYWDSLFVLKSLCA